MLKPPEVSVSQTDKTINKVCGCGSSQKTAW